jgi:hypothetical protein
MGALTDMTTIKVASRASIPLRRNRGERPHRLGPSLVRCSVNGGPVA